MAKQPVYYMQTDPKWANMDYSAKGERTTVGKSSLLTIQYIYFNARIQISKMAFLFHHLTYYIFSLYNYSQKGA